MNVTAPSRRDSKGFYNDNIENNIMADNFIVAIELASSKVTAIAGCKQPDGGIQVLAFAQEPSTTFIRKGRINNISKMTQCLTNMKEKLEKKLQKNISRVYVGIGGMGMHTVANSVVRHFDSKVEVTQEMVDAMCDENRNSNATSPDRDILEAVPQEYRLGTQLQTDPVGILAESIEGRYLNIVANSSVREEIRNCFRAANVTIADLPITVLALADSMLTESEKRSGCVFVDMGAETTSVAVFKNNLLRHLAVIPLGGANINRDITSLQVEDDEAEHLKLKYGSAVADLSEDANKSIQLQDGRKVKYNEFASLVEARVEEIILNVNNQIMLSHFDKNQLIGGIIVTGGASHMKDIDKAFRNDTKFDKIRFVRNLKIQLRTSDFSDFNHDGDCNSAIALLDKGDLNCCGGDLGNPNSEPFNNGKPQEQEVAPVDPEAERLAAEKAEQERLAAEAAAKAEQERLAAEAARRAEEERKRANRKQMFNKVKNFFSKLVNDGSND